ncbi:MAG: hypothetical protein ACXV7J_06980 [Methylomonas sp.]
MKRVLSLVICTLLSISAVQAKQEHGVTAAKDKKSGSTNGISRNPRTGGR